MAPAYGKLRNSISGFFGKPEDFRVKDHTAQFLPAKKPLSGSLCKYFESALGILVKNSKIRHLNHVV